MTDAQVAGVTSGLDLSECKLTPYAHQVVGIERLVAEPYLFLADDMGLGKCFQTIVAAQLLFQQGVIDKVIIIAPACVKSVWVDESLGELKKHLFDSTPAVVNEFHSRSTTWRQGPEAARQLEVYCTNYEFVIAKNRLKQLEAACGPKTLLILDEGAYVKSHSSLRTKACRQLRKLCGRVAILNGTPVADSPLDLFSQANLLHPSILDCPFVTLFKARYAVQTPILERGKPMVRYGKVVYDVASWTNLDDLSRRLEPVMLRRLKSEALDLPEKLPPVTITFPLTPKTWAHYKAMRDELVIWLQQSSVATAKTAAVKVMRLAQITSGFIGGIEDSGVGLPQDDLVWDLEDTKIDLPGSFLDGPQLKPEGARALQEQAEYFRGVADSTLVEIGREKLDAFLAWLELQLERDPRLKLLVQCRFRAEIQRLTKELRRLYPQADVGEIIGGQKKQERTDALRLLDPRTMPKGPAFVAMSSAGSLGLNLTAAHTVARLSRDYSLWIWLQGEDRVHRPGQVSPVSYTDFVARGPAGQRTVDHVVLEALMEKFDLAQQTSVGWVKALRRK